MKAEPTMKMSTERSTEGKNKIRVFKLEDEQEFFSLIERRMAEQGYQLLDTLKRFRKTNTVVLFR